MQQFLFCLVLASSAVANQIIDFKVDYNIAPITVQNKQPFFSWTIAAAAGERGIVPAGYTLAVTKVANTGVQDASPLWSTGAVDSNATTFIPYAGPGLTSDTDYAVSLTTAEGLTATTTFSTALFSMADWNPSNWILAQQVVNIPKGAITRARAYFAMPGYGKLQINGKKVDGVAGTRTWSQYDKRTIYGVYDVLDHVVTGDNAIGVYAGGGW
eukprot:gene13150-26895_t